MKLRDIKISRQINFGLLMIFLLLLVFGVSSIYNSNKLWQNTKSLYDNPLTVQRAIGAIESDVLNIRILMKEIVLSEGKTDIENNISHIDEYEKDINKQINILYDRYLGPKTDIELTSSAIMHWKPIRDETIRLVHDGNIIEAGSRSKTGGVGMLQAEGVIGNLSVIKDFATNKAEQLQTESQNQKADNITQLIVLTIIILLSSTSIMFFLRYSINIPLNEITKTIKLFEAGNYNIRAKYASKNEFGILTNSFNSMIKTLHDEIRNKENKAFVTSEISKEGTLEEFCQNIIQALITKTAAQIGAVYIQDNKTGDFKHYKSIGLKEDNYNSFSSTTLDGEFGSVLMKKSIVHIKNIPNDSNVVFSTFAGDYSIREIVTIPIIIDSEIVLIISIASINKYSITDILLIENIMDELTARCSSMLAAQKVIEFSSNLKSLNDELMQQGKEMEMQKDELLEQNIELEMQKKQLTEASELKSAFLSNMSHELRTPLNSVIALSSVLSRKLEDKILDEEYRYLEVIERNGKNLLSLVNDLLDLSRIESGKGDIRLTKFNIRLLISEVIAVVETQAESKGLEIINHVPSDLPKITSDVDKCMHILQNIIGNAVKFTDEGNIEIFATIEDETISISIKDTGIGIPEDKLDVVFEEFRQVDESASRRKGGTGLGLSIAKKYTTILGGTLHVESILGTGTTFMLKLPLSNETTPFESEIKQEVKIEKVNTNTALQFESKRILLVDDSEPAIIQTKYILEEQGYQIDTAKNGIEALNQIGIAYPDGMILDLMMPEMDGFQVIKTIRGNDKYAKIPVLILTAKHITKEELSFLKSNHVYQLIQKGSINKNDLISAVGNMLESINTQKIDKKKKAVGNIPRNKPLILIVEDNQDNMITVKALLEEKYDLAEAIDGKAGVEIANQIKPDLILMDISLPIIDGFAAFTAIRENNELSNVPIIALTARALEEDKKGILDYGFDDYLSKPIDKKQLDEALRENLYGK